MSQAWYEGKMAAGDTETPYFISKPSNKWIVGEQSSDPGEEGDLVDFWLSCDDLQQRR